MSSNFKTARHFSHFFSLNLDKLPTKNSDRIALRILYPGILFGLLLALLGLFDLTSSYFPLDDGALELPQVAVDGWFASWFFDGAIFVIGCGIVFKLFSSYLCYRKIFFDGKNITIVDRVLGGKKISYKEKLDNYEGVQLRIEFFQFGFWNRNRYIIELRHKNIHKIAPLYISLNGRNIRSIWKDYAKRLNLPALMFRHGELLKINTEDLDKPLLALAQEGKITSSFDINLPLPKDIVLVRKRDKKILKVRHILWDAYNFILFSFLLVLWGSLLWGGLTQFINLTSFLIMAVLLSWLSLLHFRRDKIALKKNKIVIVHKFPFLNFKNDELLKKDIEAIDVVQNPATGRYFLSIFSNSKMVIFGKKLSLEDLNWVRAFLIHDIIR